MKLFAKLVGATKNEIAFVTNTSTGLNIAAHIQYFLGLFGEAGSTIDHLDHLGL